MDRALNPVENAIRPLALTRKNALFAGHEVGAENWALLRSAFNSETHHCAAKNNRLA
jgi:Transposase IS66 family